MELADPRRLLPKQIHQLRPLSRLPALCQAVWCEARAFTTGLVTGGGWVSDSLTLTVLSVLTLTVFLSSFCLYL